ncbi:hypothetical protein NZA98_35075, partial [Escherichia coli]|nr:hypothetical protein [Escherichia coli]
MLQTGRHRDFFVYPKGDEDVLQASPEAEAPHAKPAGSIGGHTLLLILNILPIVLLSKSLASLLDHGIASFG